MARDKHRLVTMLLIGLTFGFLLGFVLMAAVGIFEFERGFGAAGGRAHRDRVVRERLAAHALGRAA